MLPEPYKRTSGPGSPALPYRDEQCVLYRRYKASSDKEGPSGTEGFHQQSVQGTWAVGHREGISL